MHGQTDRTTFIRDTSKHPLDKWPQWKVCGLELETWHAHEREHRLRNAVVPATLVAEVDHCTDLTDIVQDNLCEFLRTVRASFLVAGQGHGSKWEGAIVVPHAAEAKASSH